jgi:hypothetical protein
LFLEARVGVVAAELRPADLQIAHQTLDRQRRRVSLEHLTDRLDAYNAAFPLSRAKPEGRTVPGVGVLQVDLIQVGKRRGQQLQVVKTDRARAVGIAVRDIGAEPHPGRGRVLALVLVQRVGHLADFVGQGRRLGQARHGLDRQPRHVALVGIVHQFFHVPEVTSDATPLSAHPVAIDRPGIRADRLRSRQRSDLDQTPVIAQGHGLPGGIGHEESP